MRRSNAMSPPCSPILSFLGSTGYTSTTPTSIGKKHIVSFRDEHCIKHCLSQYTPDLSLANLDLDFHLDLDSDSDDLDSSDQSIDDLYSLQLVSVFCREISAIRAQSEHSLSLNSVEEKTAPALPPEYADFASLFQDRKKGTLPPHRLLITKSLSSLTPPPHSVPCTILRKKNSKPSVNFSTTI